MFSLVRKFNWFECPLVFNPHDVYTLSSGHFTEMYHLSGSREIKKDDAFCVMNYLVKPALDIMC
jgi:hypothetical protein